MPPAVTCLTSPEVINRTYIGAWGSEPLPAACGFVVDDGGWRPVPTCWRSAELHGLVTPDQEAWAEASTGCPTELEVLNAPVETVDAGPLLEMDILVRAKERGMKYPSPAGCGHVIPMGPPPIHIQYLTGN